jgi:hypothetical protein
MIVGQAAENPTLPASSSIRVSAATRRVLAGLAACEGSSLTAYMDRLAAWAAREAAFAEHRSALTRDAGGQAAAQWGEEQESWSRADQDGLG